MKENFDPNQVVISREYFNQLVEMAKSNDHVSGTSNHPNRTALGRILWHARKYNYHLHTKRQVEVETELVQKRMRRRRLLEIVKRYKQVYVLDDPIDHPAVVCGESRKKKFHIRLMVTRGNKCAFETIHVDDIILSPRA